MGPAIHVVPCGPAEVHLPPPWSGLIGVGCPPYKSDANHILLGSGTEAQGPEQP